MGIQYIHNVENRREGHRDRSTRNRDSARERERWTETYKKRQEERQRDLDRQIDREQMKIYMSPCAAFKVIIWINLLFFSKGAFESS